MFKELFISLKGFFLFFAKIERVEAGFFKQHSRIPFFVTNSKILSFFLLFSR